MQVTDYGRSSQYSSRLNYAYLEYYNQPPSQYLSILVCIPPKISTLPPLEPSSHPQIPPHFQKTTKSPSPKKPQQPDLQAPPRSTVYLQYTDNLHTINKEG